MYGTLVKHPTRVLLVVFAVLAPLLSYFLIFRVEIESDIRRGFAHKNGRSTKELKKFADFHNISGDGLELWVILVTPKRGESTHLQMSQKLLDEIQRLDEHVQNISVSYSGGNTRFTDTQGSNINYLFYGYKSAYEFSDIFPDSINLSYPTSTVFEHSIFLGSHFFGVNENITSSTMETVQYVTLWYMANAPSFEKKKQLAAIEMAVFQLSRRDDFSPLISFQMYGDQIANAEMLRGTFLTIPLFVVGVMLMIIFMLFLFNHLTLKSQVLMIFSALLAPILATATCFAVLGWCGVSMNAIMCITPFLIMGIGVDDAFLLLHSWRRRLNSSTKTVRLQLVLLEIGPSMAITSITNTLAFGIGVASASPTMSSFCLCTAIAVMVDFVLEFLIFVPLMVVFYEEKPAQKTVLPSTESFSCTWSGYTSTLLSTIGRVTVILFTIFLYVSASFGVSQLIPSFDPSKTFPSDSDLLDSLRNFEKVTSEYGPVTYITNRLPDLENELETMNFFEMIEKLENRSFCYGKERTQLLLRDYLEQQRSSNESISYDGIPKFVNDRKIEGKNIINFHHTNGSVVVDGINFVIVCRGELDWNKRASRIEEARQIIDSYPQFNTSLFDYDNTIYDLISTVKNELIKAVLLTFFCMLVACGILIPSFVGATIAALSMLSISYSLLGWLSIWGQDLDPVTMINVLMAIGFSVDFSAHVCYHFHVSCVESPGMSSSRRIEGILRSVGRPMIEASLSTLFCMCPLFLVPVYMIQSFARTVSLVASLGLLHGIFIIPVVLYYLSPKPILPETEAERMLQT